jgi:hypothetical protein
MARETGGKERNASHIIHYNEKKVLRKIFGSKTDKVTADKAKLSLCLIKSYAIKKYGGVEV